MITRNKHIWYVCSLCHLSCGIEEIFMFSKTSIISLVMVNITKTEHNIGTRNIFGRGSKRHLCFSVFSHRTDIVHNGSEVSNTRPRFMTCMCIRDKDCGKILIALKHERISLALIRKNLEAVVIETCRCGVGMDLVGRDCHTIHLHRCDQQREVSTRWHRHTRHATWDSNSFNVRHTILKRHLCLHTHGHE